MVSELLIDHHDQIIHIKEKRGGKNLGGIIVLNWIDFVEELTTVNDVCTCKSIETFRRTPCVQALTSGFKQAKIKNFVESGIWTHALSDQNLNLAP